MLMRVLRLPNDEQQTEYNGQDHPLTSSDPGGTRIYNPYQSFISSIEITWLTKQKQRLRFLFSKPRQRLYRLRLKFVQTTRVVCTDYSWSLQKVLRTYNFKYA